MCIFFDKLYTRVMFCIFYSSKKSGVSHLSGFRFVLHPCFSFSASSVKFYLVFDGIEKN